MFLAVVVFWAYGIGMWTTSNSHFSNDSITLLHGLKEKKN